MVPRPSVWVVRLRMLTPSIEEATLLPSGVTICRSLSAPASVRSSGEPSTESAAGRKTLVMAGPWIHATLRELTPGEDDCQARQKYRLQVGNASEDHCGSFLASSRCCLISGSVLAAKAFTTASSPLSAYFANKSTAVSCALICCLA